MKNLFLVFLGGGLGSMSRYAVYKLMLWGEFTSSLATFAVNITGSLVLGIIMGFAFKEGQFSNTLLLFLTTGFCGGFTTFSTFAFENQAYLRTGEYFSFSIYAFGSLFLGIIAVFAGIFLSKWV